MTTFKSPMKKPRIISFVTGFGSITISWFSLKRLVQHDRPAFVSRHGRERRLQHLGVAVDNGILDAVTLVENALRITVNIPGSVADLYYCLYLAIKLNRERLQRAQLFRWETQGERANKLSWVAIIGAGDLGSGSDRLPAKSGSTRPPPTTSMEPKGRSSA